MNFLNKIVATLSELLKMSLEIEDYPASIKSKVAEDLYLYLNKAVLSGEYCDPGAIQKIDEIKEYIDKLHIRITNHLQHSEANLQLRRAGAVSQIETADKATSVNTQEQAATLNETENITEELKRTKEKKEPTASITFQNCAQYLEHFKTKYVEKFKDLSFSVQKNLEYFSTGQDGEITDITLLKNYKLKNELAETLGAHAVLKDIFHTSLFELNILLAYMDEYLECNDETITELVSIQSYLRNDLRNNINGEIFDLIKYKAEFLQFKVTWRNTHDPEDASEAPKKISEENPYNKFHEKLITHYYNMNRNFVFTCEKDIQRFSANQLQNVTLEPFHHLNRYYKKKAGNPKGYAKNLIDELIKKMKAVGGMETPNLFDQIAHKSIFNLLQNSSSYLSLEGEKEKAYTSIISELRKTSEEKLEPRSVFIDNYYQKIKYPEPVNLLGDYYGLRTLYKFLIEFAWELQQDTQKIIFIKEGSDDEKISEAKNKSLQVVSYLQTTAQSVLKDLKSSLKKMMTHEVKPAYLTFTECQIPHIWQDSESGKLFLDSSYLPPNNFAKVKGEIASWETIQNNQFDNLRNAIEMKTNHFITDYKNTSFEKKVKENEFKVVQIIAMFVSIATFVLINVKIFDNKSGLESFAIIMGLASCFILFNLVFYFIIMAQLQVNKSIWVRTAKLSLFFILPLALSIGSYFILSSEGEKFNKEIKQLKDKIKTDSTEFRHLID